MSVHHAVVAALDAGVVLVARGQKESVGVAIRERPERGNLPIIIDKRRRT